MSNINDDFSKVYANGDVFIVYITARGVSVTAFRTVNDLLFSDLVTNDNASHSYPIVRCYIRDKRCLVNTLNELVSLLITDADIDNENDVGE